MAGGKQTSLDGSPTRTEFWLLGPHLPPQRPGAKDSYTDPARQYFTGICVTEIQKGALAPRQGYNPGMNPARERSTGGDELNGTVLFLKYDICLVRKKCCYSAQMIP